MLARACVSAALGAPRVAAGAVRTAAASTAVVRQPGVVRWAVAGARGRAGVEARAAAVPCGAMCESQARFASSNAGAYDDDDPFASDSEGPSSMRDQEAERQEFLSRASPDKALGYFADELTQVDFSERERRRIRDKVLKWDEKDVTPAQRARTKTRLGEASPFRKFDPYTYQDLQNRAAEFWAPEDEFNWKLEGLGPITSKDMVHRKRGGLLQDYCVFCYHGTSQMRPENTTLLTKFVSDAGQILPRRSTKCCAKHQRKLRRTIKRARVLQLMPYNQRLHPKLRATQFMPDPETHKPVTFTTPRDAFRAAQAYEAWVWNHASNRKGRNVPQVDWFPSEE